MKINLLKPSLIFLVACLGFQNIPLKAGDYSNFNLGGLIAGVAVLALIVGGASAAAVSSATKPAEKKQDATTDSNDAQQEVIYAQMSDFNKIKTQSVLELDLTIGEENSVKMNGSKKCASSLKPVIENNELILQYQDAELLQQCKSTKVQVASKNAVTSIKNMCA